MGRQGGPDEAGDLCLCSHPGPTDVKIRAESKG